MGNNFLVLQNEILMAIIHQFKVRSSQVSLSGRKNGISRGLPTMMVKNTVKKGGVNICLLKIVIITFHQLCSDCVCYRLIILHSPIIYARQIQYMLTYAEVKQEEFDRQT